MSTSHLATKGTSNIMSKFIMTTAIALTLGAGAAQAATSLDNGWYLSLGGGWNHVDDSRFKAGGIKNSVDFDEGWVGNVAIGHAWGMNMRTELEGSYRHNDTGTIRGTGAAGSGGRFHSWNAMLNEYYDFNNNSAWTPYVGLGIGASLENARNIGNVFAAGTRVDDWDTQFAYQGIAGVDYWATPHSAFGLRYNYFGTTRGKFDTNNAAIGRAKADYQNHAILATYRWQWGMPQQMVAEPRHMVEMPAPAVTRTTYDTTTMRTIPTERQIEDSPYKIFFANDSAKLNSEGRQVVADAAAIANKDSNVVVHLTANTDTTGSARHNERLSEQRAKTVRAALLAQGVPAQQINMISNAERDLPVPTGDKVREPRNRVVTIILQ